MKYFILLILLFQVSFAEMPKDTDNDLVPDSVDLCPNTQEGVFVDKFGCRKAIQKIIYFDHSQTIIKPDQYMVINDVIALAKELKGYKIYIQGYADSTASATINIAISKQRASNVFKALSKELDKSRIIISWYGESEPIASNVTKEGRSQNRRVTIQLR
jgi:OmpA-OmpF porin, OOP family